MRRIVVSLVGVSLLLLAAFPQPPPEAATPPRPTNPLLKYPLYQAVSSLTAVAISPLLGVCVLGVSEYVRMAHEDRGKLPSYATPWFTVPAGILLVLILVKDTTGAHAPLMQKALDASEVLIVNKASLLVIGLPVVFHQVARVVGFDS